MTAGVGGGGLALWLGFQKSGKKKKTKTTARSIIICRRFFIGNPGKKKKKLRKFTSPIRTALSMVRDFGALRTG